VTAAARRQVSKDVRTSWRKAGLGEKELTVAHVLWGLRDDGTVRCRRTDDISKLLGADASPLTALLEDAMLGHTLDVSGMYADRAGLFGKGWLQLLSASGLDRPQALNALAAVANTLQGTSGTQKIWKAFTTALDEPDCGLVGRVQSQNSYAGAFANWAGVIRQRLRNESVDDDEPYRLLAAAGAVGMAPVDMADFAGLVQDWIDAEEQGELQAVSDWAADLTEAIEQAGLSVARDRFHRGCKKIRARDRARADTKAKALDRRQEMLKLDTKGKGEVDVRSRDILAKSIAKLKPIRKAKKAMAVKKTVVRAKADTGRAKERPQTGLATVALLQSAPACVDPGQAQEWSTDARGRRAAARAEQSDMAEEAVLRDDSRGLSKRRAQPTGGRAKKHRLCEGAATQLAEETAQGTQSNRKRGTDDNGTLVGTDKRTRLHREAKRPAAGQAHATEQGTHRKRQTRETATIGTTNLEPD
jgi:hypothetical protein